jgi:hypothetical protein
LETKALPSSQYGFRPKRSCSTALATAHAGWLKCASLGSEPVVGTLGFNLSSAFDTVAAASLLPKLEATGIRGMSLSWFQSYMSDGRQWVDWNGTKSSLIDVKYVVRQGSILGLLLFLVNVADLPVHVGLGQESAAMYTDDLDMWQQGKDKATVASKLEVIAARFVKFAKGNGMSINACKTQLMYSRGNSSKSSSSRNSNGTVIVDGVNIEPSETFKLLRVVFDRSLSMAPQEASVAMSAHQRASLVARLVHHLPRGKILRQLSMGLLCGKVSHALAAVSTPRLLPEDKEHVRKSAVQVSLNDAARTITGCKRTDRVKVSDLIRRAGVTSFNHQVASATGMEAWSAFSSSDGGDGCRNPVGNLVFDNIVRARPSRAASAGLIPVPLRGVNTMINNLARFWNACPSLRLAETKCAAKKAVQLLVSDLPL